MGGALGTKTSQVLSIGVTGHLLLDSDERQHVAEHARSQLDSLFQDVGEVAKVHLVSGLAPGSDLVLTESLLAGCEAHGIACQLTAAIVDSPEDILHRWQERAEELGATITPYVVEQVSQKLRQLLLRADRQLRLMSPLGAPKRGYQQLSAMLAESCDVLVAVVRQSHPNQDGGTAETVDWWKDLEKVPSELRLGFARNQDLSQRRLIEINPALHSQSSRRHVLAELNDVRAHLRAGNPLTASDVAAHALLRYPDHSLLRYFYLLSLAQCGSTYRALRLYEQWAPATPAEPDEDWLALHGRLFKDLALLGQDRQNNLERAARHYAEAFAVTGGIFSAINAATMYALISREEEARSFATQVIERSLLEVPTNESETYYHHVSCAEAHAVLREWDACRMALRSANPLLRADLNARARTRNQLRELLRHVQGDPAILDELALPYVYLLPSVADCPSSMPADLIQILEGSPLYAIGTSANGVAEKVLKQLGGLGMRVHLLDKEIEDDSTIREGIERRVCLRGFREHETLWFEQMAQRHLYGLAAINARQLNVELRQLVQQGTGSSLAWDITSAPPSLPEVKAPAGREMLGLVFTDLVGFSKYSDEDVEIYFTKIVPELAVALEPWKDAILLQQTWGDAIHLVTRDAVSAAHASQAMLHTVRSLRGILSTPMRKLEMRVGAHFAPAYVGIDAISSTPTWFGSQLSLTARVEPVTPPGMTYVTEQFAAELAITAPDQFLLEYAGEVQLAKKHGEFRLYSLNSV